MAMGDIRKVKEQKLLWRREMRGESNLIVGEGCW
jgi:hypothetical protein